MNQGRNEWALALSLGGPNVPRESETERRRAGESLQDRKVVQGVDSVGAGICLQHLYRGDELPGRSWV